jgi:iron complex transport system ATP-binding protein
MIELRQAGAGYGGREVLRGINLAMAKGEFVSLLGPNGAGKSTLLHVIAGLRPYTGSCRLQGCEVREWRRREFARIVAVVPQSVRVEFPFTAREVVLMGRAPHAAWSGESAMDTAAVESAMQRADCTAFASRDFRSLSGGERQRVLLASALAQEPSLLLLDEPATFLDIQHQLLIYRLLRSMAAAGVLVCAATHDVNLAAAFSSRVVVLNGGEIAADGSPEEVLSAALLESVFQVRGVREDRDGRPWFRYGA